jgi:hypothetical protein
MVFKKLTRFALVTLSGFLITYPSISSSRCLSFSNFIIASSSVQYDHAVLPKSLSFANTSRSGYSFP